MTPETDNAIRAACRRCTEEIQQAMRDYSAGHFAAAPVRAL